MGSPGTALAGNAVILNCLGEQVWIATTPPSTPWYSGTHAECHKILNQSLLYDLCLVSRRFHAEFSPFLYRHVRVIANGQGLQALGNPGRFRSTRSISCSGPAVAQDINNCIVELLPLMPSLESFRYSASHRGVRHGSNIPTAGPMCLSRRPHCNCCPDPPSKAYVSTTPKTQHGAC